jgi:hypothetical protein
LALPEAPLGWTVDDLVCAWILPALLADLPVALSTESIDLGLHPGQ